MKAVTFLLVMTIFCLNSVITQAGNVIVNVRKNVVNHKDDNSSINSDINLGNSNTNLLKGNGIKGSRTVTLPKFSLLYITGVFEVTVTCSRSANNSMKITGDTNLIKLVDTQLEIRRLKLQIPKSYTTKTPIKLALNVNNFAQLQVAGANIITMHKLNTENFKLIASGGSKTTISGKVAKLLITAQGAAGVEATNLICQQIRIDASGATKIFVTAKQKLEINAKNAAKIYYNGKPGKIIKNISGAAKVNNAIPITGSF